MPVLTRTRPETCSSDRMLDMLAAGELAAERRAEVEDHLASCAMCAARQRELASAKEAFATRAPRLRDWTEPPPPASPQRAPRSMRRVWNAGAVLATAAALAMMVRAGGDSFSNRVKGAAHLGFFVAHDGKVREGVGGEVVAPGDRLQLVYTSPAPRFVAVLSRDGGGRASIYFPREPTATRLGAGTKSPFPYALELDDTTGTETLYGLFCDRAEALEPLRRALEVDRERAAFPRDCHVDQVIFQKRR
jgi:Putative zinc-finger